MHYHLLLVSALLLCLAQASYRNVNDVTKTVTEKEIVTDQETVTKTVTNVDTYAGSFTTISWSTTITPTTYTPSRSSSELSETKIDTQKSDESHAGSTTSTGTATSANSVASTSSTTSAGSITSASSTTSTGSTTSVSSKTSVSLTSPPSSTSSESSEHPTSSSSSESSTSPAITTSSDSSSNHSGSSVSADSAFYTSFTDGFGSLLAGSASYFIVTVSGSLLTGLAFISSSTPNPMSSSQSSNTASSGDPTLGSPTTNSPILSSNSPTSSRTPVSASPSSSSNIASSGDPTISSPSTDSSFPSSSSSLDSSSTSFSFVILGSMPTSTNSELESLTPKSSTSTSITVTIPTPPDSMISDTNPASTNSRSAATSSTVASSTTPWSTNLSSLRDALSSAGWVLPSTFSGYPSVDTFRSSSTFNRSLTAGSTSTMSASASSSLADSGSSISTTSLSSGYGATSFSSPTRSARTSNSLRTSTDVSLLGADSSVSRSSPSATGPAAMSTTSISNSSSTGTSAAVAISSGSPSGSSAGACLTAEQRERLNELKSKLEGTNLTNDELNELTRLQNKANDCEAEEEEALHDLRLNAEMYREYDVQKFLEEKLAEFENLPVGDKGNYKKHDGLDFSFAQWLFHKHTKASPDTIFCDGQRLCSYSITSSIVKTGDARLDAQILLALQSITVWSGHVKDFIQSFGDAFDYAIATTDEMVRDLSIFKETQQRVENREKTIKTIFNIVLFGALQLNTMLGSATISGQKNSGPLGLLFGTISNGIVLANSLHGVWTETLKDPTEDVAADLKFEMNRVFNATHHYFQTESANILGGKKNADGTYMFLNIMQQPAILEWFSSNVNEDYTEPIKKGVMSRLVHGILGELQEASIMAVWLPVRCESPGHWGYKMCFNDHDYWRMPEDPICFSGYGNIGFTLRWKYMMDNKKYDRDYMPANVTKKLSKYETSLDDIVRASLAWRATHGDTPLLNAGAGNITDIMKPDELSIAQREFAGPLYGQVAFRIEDHTSEHLANQVLPAPWSSIASPEHGEHKDNCRREACKIKQLGKKKNGKIAPDAPKPACATDAEHCHDNC